MSAECFFVDLNKQLLVYEIGFLHKKPPMSLCFSGSDLVEKQPIELEYTVLCADSFKHFSVVSDEFFSKRGSGTEERRKRKKMAGAEIHCPSQPKKWSASTAIRFVCLPLIELRENGNRHRPRFLK
ncbi:hypothetical protein BaRGS_00010524 [Batillaria attramentaria]|uniref:Uncharacterized protein n=1 Tax=Batillaria attramentaria TaxID=370345 RepID=A0ABD0LH35_9CAEN